MIDPVRRSLLKPGIRGMEKTVKFSPTRRQQGFTLVEIAIVVAIIGLLIGGVLKGQEMITNANLKRIESDNANLMMAIFSYQDRYRQMPGDARPTAVERIISVLRSVGPGQLACSRCFGSDGRFGFRRFIGGR